ncbi:MAG: 30S ribosomal protein S2 [Candidatus Peribacteria bacterium]|jgi:small subunit ribosomal protein S2|nr:30S ribosomal protein S2 [Candidatus Peribacteria bacterium]
MTITTQQVLDAKVHFGSLKNESHPKTSPYWAEISNGLVVINPDTIAQQINNVRNLLEEAKKAGKEILVVSEKKMYAQDLENLAKKAGFAYLNYKIPGGFLTNFNTFKKRIDAINDMEKFMDSEAYHTLTKKEQLIYKRKFARVNKIYKGVTKLIKRPEVVIVLDGTMLGVFLDEAKKVANLETIVIASTNFPRYWNTNHIIMANVHSHKAVDFVMKSILG